MSADTPQPEAQARRGRRAALLPKGRLDTATLLAAALPVLTLGAALLMTPRVEQPTPNPPTQAPLAHLDRGCPAALPGEGTLVVGSSTATPGEVTLRMLAGTQTEPEPLQLGAGQVTEAPVPGKPALVSADDEQAVGLLAARTRPKPLASVPCPVPTSDAWFTGLGARSSHASVLEIDNPDVGAAVVDVVVLSRQGIVAAPELRGIRIPGRTSVTVDLAARIPRRGDIAVEVAVSRGRAAVTARDGSGRPGEGLRTDWLPAQVEPSDTNVVLGLPRGTGARTLSVANTGDNEAVVSLRVITPSTTFTPAGSEEFRVKPGALVGVPLRKVLASKAAADATGILVEASEPVTAAVRSTVGGDVALATAAASVVESGAALVPEGTATLLLSGAESDGSVAVTVRDASGRTLLDRTVDVSPDRGGSLDLPDGAALVAITPAGTPVAAAVLVTGKAGLVVVPVSEVPQHALLPSVGPALP
ncbi:MAG: DUF5719 family protein [Nocardioidaceae bacterium]